MIERALGNCHAEGVDSIVFRQTKDWRLLRLFVAHPHHTLWTNSLDPTVEQSVAFHPHHCDVTLIAVSGIVSNFWGYRPDALRESAGLSLWPYRWSSKITGGTGRMVKLSADPVPFRTYDGPPLNRGDVTSMPAHRCHTIRVPKNSAAAWFVIEGEEDPFYSPICYSMRGDLDKDDLATLYQPMTQESIRQALRVAFPDVPVSEW